MKPIKLIFLLLIIASGLNPSLINAQTTITLDSTVLTERDIATGLQVPWEILWGPDDHIWVTERRGQVLRIEPNTGNTALILNIQSSVAAFGEPGLLGMALHPDFENTPKNRRPQSCIFKKGLSLRADFLALNLSITVVSSHLTSKSPLPPIQSARPQIS